MERQSDERFMRRALRLAKRGAGFTAPNPLVGAVLVRDGQVIGEGWHRRFGGLHAEREALKNCGGPTQGATLYVTLEPCCHRGKQPPCTEAILESGIKRVVVGCADPNPLVAGKGISILRQAGIEVEEKVLEEECRRLNRIFFHYIAGKRPYVVLKYAMTLDGKIATADGRSRWITGPAARERVHRDRSRLAAVMVGVGTVLADDPMLNCRLTETEREREDGRSAAPHQPLRIVCDSGLRIPASARIVATARDFPTLIATCCGDASRQEPYRKAGCRLWQLREREGRPDLEELMERLGAEGIDSVLLEGGPTLAAEALKLGLADCVQAYIAPKLFGGRTAPSPLGGRGIPDPAAAVRLRSVRIERLGDDILAEGEVEKNVYRNCGSGGTYPAD